MGPRQVVPFALAAVLFLTSLLTGRLIAANPLPLSELGAPSPSAAAAASTPAPTPTPRPTPDRAATPPPPTPTLQESGTVVLDQGNTTVYHLPEGCLTHPLRLAMRGSDLYALDSGQLKHIALGSPATCRPIPVPDGGADGVMVQELGDFALAGDGGSLLLLDRAGNVFRYLLEDEDWEVERLAHAPGASARQYLVSICASQDAFYLLDTSVGQIWKHAHGVAEVLPVEMDLRESVDLAVAESIYVLDPEGYQGPVRLYRLGGEPLKPDSAFTPPADLANPSLLFLDAELGGYLYVIEQDGRRLRLLSTESGELVREYLLDSEDTDILAVYTQGHKLYLASTDTIYVYPQEPAGPGDWLSRPAPTSGVDGLSPHDPLLLQGLPPLALPLEGTAISELSFRLPGAPRSYRYGVHEGLDFYWAAGQPVTTTTPVLSVAEGVVLRADIDYHPPNLKDMEAILAHAAELSHTPEEVLDVLRGRQIWIDHGGGLVTRYCHLSAVAQDLQGGDRVVQGQTIGYVGNSGTPSSYYDQGSEMHLHLEIRIGQGYLGQYLRPVEVKRWLHRAFSEGA